jgi:hypothetical protein
MRCPSCGHDVPDSPFCERCGKPLKAENATPIKPQSGPALDAKAADRPDHVGSQPRWHGTVWASLALALYIAVADAAVETFLGQSPLRWWIAGAAVLYFGLCAATWRLMPGIWRRMDWATKAAVSLIVLLAFLGATAWMPEGLEQGLSLFGQTTATVLAVVSAVVVALAGFFLVRLPFIPLPGKMIAGLLAGYGVAAFLIGAHAGTPYPSLFHGGSQWTRLPFWLQGATLGSLLLVPLALLLEIGTGTRRVTRGKSSEFAFKMIALGMGLTISFAAVRIPVSDVSAASATPTPIATSPDTPANTPAGPSTQTTTGSSGNQDNPPRDEAGYKQASASLDRLYAGLDVIDSKMDHSLFEIDALAAKLGSDPTAIFHFVRDEIRYEPYTGVLRGALGTLLCRAGNSLDRSLLLAALLQKAGYKTQIAAGHLTTRPAQILVNRLFEPVKPVASGMPSFAELAPGLSAAMGVDQSTLVQGAERLRENGDMRKKELLNHVDSQTSLLSDLFGKAGVSAGVITPNDQLLAEVSDHYWVQYQNPAGQWVDLDSSFPDAEPGKTVVSPTNTFAPDSVPEVLYHHLQITLTLRVAKVVGGNDGETADTILLDRELRVADQQGKDIIVASFPVPLPSSINPSLGLADTLAATKGFQTFVRVGSDVTAGEYFDLEGQVSDTPGGPVGEVVANAGGIGKSVGGLTGGINGVFGGGEASPGNATRIVGLWVDYKLISPRPGGETPVSLNYHRDIIPATQVTAWSVRSADSPQRVATKLDKAQLSQRLLWRAELLPVVGAIAVDYAGYLAITSLSKNRTWTDTLAKTVFGLSQISSLGSPSDRAPIESLLLVEGAAGLAGDFNRSKFPALQSYFAKPGLVAYETVVGDTSDRAYFRRGFDIIAYSPRIVGHDANPSSQIRQDASTLSLRDGVMATELEWGLMASLQGSSVDNIKGPASFGAARILAVARASGVPLILIKPGATGFNTLADTGLPDAVKAELSATLAAGEDVVVPVRPVVLDGRGEVAWWRLEPRSGEVIGVMPGGRGQDYTEYFQVVWVGFSYFLCGYDALKGEAERGRAASGGEMAQDLILLASCMAEATAFPVGESEVGWALSNPEYWTAIDIVSVVMYHAIS